MSDIERSESDWRLAARVAVTRCGAMTQFQIRKRFTASELFFGFLAPDKLQDTTVRFSGVDLSPCPGTLVKIRLLASRATHKNHCCARPFSKIVE